MNNFASKGTKKLAITQIYFTKITRNLVHDIPQITEFERSKEITINFCNI